MSLVVPLINSFFHNTEVVSAFKADDDAGRHSPQKKKGSSSVESVGGPIGSGRPVASGSGDGSTVPKSDSDANVDDKN